MVRAFFKLSKTEMNGLLFFSAILVIGVILPCYLVLSDTPEEPISLIETKRSSPVIRHSLSSEESDTKAGVATIPIVLPLDFSFDPNRMDQKLGRKLGLKDYQTNMIMRYIEKGGLFKLPSDFKKIYALKEDDYNRLLPYIKIDRLSDERILSDFEPTKGNESKFSQKASEKADFKIALNSTDSLSLQALKGIGPVLSARIIKYRNRLGGFHHIDQLREVYGLDSALISALSRKLEIDTTMLQKIPVNKISLDELRRFPYLNYKQSKVIVNYRSQHGKFNDLQDIAKIKILDEEILRKIAPYFDYND